MAVARKSESRLSVWRRPNGERHVTHLELASIEMAVGMGQLPNQFHRTETRECLTEAQLRVEVGSTLLAARIEPAKVYAFLSTGYLITVDNLWKWSVPQLIAWEQAIADYETMHSAQA